MIGRVLAWLFPPVLPGRVRDWEPIQDSVVIEHGWAGNVRRKYKDGIDRYWSEHPIRRIDRRQWGIQLRHAEETMAAFEQDLTAQGYINTIHDCWEKTDDLGDLQKLSLAGPPRK